MIIPGSTELDSLHSLHQSPSPARGARASSSRVGYPSEQRQSTFLSAQDKANKANTIEFLPLYWRKLPLGFLIRITARNFPGISIPMVVAETAYVDIWVSLTSILDHDMRSSSCVNCDVVRISRSSERVFKLLSRVFSPSQSLTSLFSSQLLDLHHSLFLSELSSRCLHHTICRPTLSRWNHLNGMITMISLETWLVMARNHSIRNGPMEQR